MAATLCKTFRLLGSWTHRTLTRAEGVRHQPLEETFTDLNMLRLMHYHPADIHTKVFKKWEEGKNGADWQWWIVNASRTSSVGFRVQAKVLNLGTDTFQHLHYAPAKGAKQIDKLETDALLHGLIPLYCLYLRIDVHHRQYQPRTHVRKERPRLFGCSLVTLPDVRALSLKSYRLEDLLPKCSPWHHLVCDTTGTGADLPARARTFAHSIGAHLVGMTDLPSTRPLRSLDDPIPQYVLDIADGRETDGIRGARPDEDTCGVVVIAPPRRRDES